MNKSNEKDDFDNTLCICCIHVFEHKRPVLLVDRGVKVSDDKLEPVEYMCGEEDHYSHNDGRMVGFGHLAECDPTILSPRSVSPGQTFSRLSVHDGWEEET